MEYWAPLRPRLPKGKILDLPRSAAWEGNIPDVLPFGLH